MSAIDAVVSATSQYPPTVTVRKSTPSGRVKIQANLIENAEDPCGYAYQVSVATVTNGGPMAEQMETVVYRITSGDDSVVTLRGPANNSPQHRVASIWQADGPRSDKNDIEERALAAVDEMHRIALDVKDRDGDLRPEAIARLYMSLVDRAAIPPSVCR